MKLESFFSFGGSKEPEQTTGGIFTIGPPLGSVLAGGQPEERVLGLQQADRAKARGHGSRWPHGRVRDELGEAPRSELIVKIIVRV